MAAGHSRRMGDAELMAKAPPLIKVCSPAFVRELVKRALPGLALTHLPVPPPAVSRASKRNTSVSARVAPAGTTST